MSTKNLNKKLNHHNLSQPSANPNFNEVRVRFAPSPTGLMHLGNVRTAVLNYLFALRYQGTFVLRIEDTDPERNFDVGAKQILADLAWLNLKYQEGPYFQSQRASYYQAALDQLIQKNLVYRCFCSNLELERKRELQIAMHLAPRYDRTCAQLTAAQIQAKLAQAEPFIWRFAINQAQQAKFYDLAKGLLEFELKNFSDFPLTRQDQSFTFIFANFVDDMDMRISHVLRGDDHLTNTVSQILLYQAFEKPVPTFWHLPLICNLEGKKLSKRDFGFSLGDLQKAGFLPEAINNYLGIIGATFTEEILSLTELSQALDFEHIHSAGQIKYDVKKLEWVNHKWISKLTPAELVPLCKPFLEAAYPEKLNPHNHTQLLKLVQLIHTDLVTLAEIVPLTKFYFCEPDYNLIRQNLSPAVKQLIQKFLLAQNNLANYTPEQLLNCLKEQANQAKIPAKTFFPALRLSLTGAPAGLHIVDLIDTLGLAETQKRLQQAVS
ncbi:MAG TPA: glutamate--tRNA ligase [Candidatus Babeliales bacterium]|nr:glutamate--tRNA ligase [Candidatus Babeliales bacterium]